MSTQTMAPVWVRASLVVILTAVMAVAAIYLAGAVLLFLLFKTNMTKPDFMTWWGYFSTYGIASSVGPQLKLSGIAGLMVFFSPIVLFFLKPQVAQHGKAHFAGAIDVKRARLLDQAGDGVIVGRYRGKVMLANKELYPHIVLAAPTGSGKGVGVVVPNLLNWNHSVVVLDIKRENFNLTAGFRAKHGQKVFAFDPMHPDGRTHRYNPLSYISEKPNQRIDDIQKIGEILFPDQPGQDPLWSSSARSLFLGVVLYLIESGRVVTLGQVGREAMGADDKRFGKILEDARKDGKPFSHQCESALNDYLNTSDNTRTSIRKTFSARFEVFLNPIVDAATSDNDFDLREIRRQRMSIYVCVVNDDLRRLSVLMNMFFQQLCGLNTRTLPEEDKTLKFQCLLLLDEFKSLGKMPTIVDGIAFFRGYGLRLLPIFQTPTQVSEIYGKDAAETFFDNFNLRMVYTPSNQTAAESISRELGTYSFKSRSKSRTMAMLGGGKSSGPSISESDQARALMLPQEVKEIGNEEVLILAKNAPPIRGSKIRWYKDPDFKSRILPPPDVPAVDIDKTPRSTVVDLSNFRKVTADDMDGLENKSIEDFSGAWVDKPLPTGNLSEADVSRWIDDVFCGK